MSHTPDKFDSVKRIAKGLCRSESQVRYVLAALANAVQERLGEDVILCPRKGENIHTAATLFSVRFEWEERILWRHYIFYGEPKSISQEELLRVTLDVAHELGHLVLESGPGRISMRIGISDSDKQHLREVEADWFALCVLQMVGCFFD